MRILVTYDLGPYTPILAIGLIGIAFPLIFSMGVFNPRIPGRLSLLKLDLISYIFASTSILIFFISVANREVSKHEIAIKSEILIEYHDPYDPRVLLPEIKTSLKTECGNMPSECDEIKLVISDQRSEFGPTIHRKLPDNRVFSYGLREMIAKYNYGVANQPPEPFLGDRDGILTFVAVNFLLIGLVTGLFRRILTIKEESAKSN